MTPGWKCPRRVGFLFPHACHRPSPEGCPDCQNGEIDDPYIHRTDRYYYEDYDTYEPSLTGYAMGSMMHDRSHFIEDPQFTEADGESLVTPDDDFETDASAS